MKILLTNKKHFLKTIIHYDFAYAFSADVPRIIVVHDFLLSSLKLENIGILTRRLLVISSQTLSCELNSLRL